MTTHSARLSVSAAASQMNTTKLWFLAVYGGSGTCVRHAAPPRVPRWRPRCLGTVERPDGSIHRTPGETPHLNTKAAGRPSACLLWPSQYMRPAMSSLPSPGSLTRTALSDEPSNVLLARSSSNLCNCSNLSSYMLLLRPHEGPPEADCMRKQNA
jgi:hypothetical protein